MLQIKGPETRQCPPDIQERVTRTFGRNKFGDPLYRIAWGQSELHVMGNIWRDKHGTERRGYRHRYLCHGQPCWNVLHWREPSEFGSPRTFYANTYDDVSGLYMMGAYPWRGRYVVMLPLIHKEFVDGELKVTHFPISHAMVDTIIPLIVAWQYLSFAQRKVAVEAAKQAEAKRETERITDMMMDSLPAWFGAVSFSGQGIHTSLIDRKMEQIHAAWSRMCKNGKVPRFQAGLTRGNQPKIAAHV
jgi:hypothetical protein